MSATPFDVQPVADRIRAMVPSLRLVGLAADYASLKNLRDFAPPCAYVVLAQERFEENQPGHGSRGEQVRVVQRGSAEFGVVVVGRNYRSGHGGQLSAEMSALLGQVRGSLLGWVPQTPGARPLQLRRGDLLEYDDSTALWCDVWKTQTTIGSEANA